MEGEGSSGPSALARLLNGFHLLLTCLHEKDLGKQCTIYLCFLHQNVQTAFPDRLLRDSLDSYK